MKQKILKLTPEELIRTLQGNKTQQLNLPTDTELVNIKYNTFTKQLTAIIRSDTFENIPEGTPIPDYTHKILPHKQTPIPPVDFTQRNVTQAQPTPQKTLIQTLTTPSSSSLNDPKIGVKTLESKHEPNVDTCGFEDEFTKEQRKVLKFTSEGDYVIVKPIQFLKTEWDDINDTVKSIGGKWVKGSTIDYWAIPKNQKHEE
ncbi:MAG: hypothetical protein LBE76_01930 [Nitrososphaerota archaeon]|jgi:hypothetical protein|nr:hypothetical protein [Nitrososphaerota archaeon]